MKISNSDLSVFLSAVLELEVCVVKQDRKHITYNKVGGKRNYKIGTHHMLVLALICLENVSKDSVYVNIGAECYSIKIGKLNIKSTIWLNTLYLALMATINKGLVLVHGDSDEK